MWSVFFSRRIVLLMVFVILTMVSLMCLSDKLNSYNHFSHWKKLDVSVNNQHEILWYDWYKIICWSSVVYVLDMADIFSFLNLCFIIDQYIFEIITWTLHLSTLFYQATLGKHASNFLFCDREIVVLGLTSPNGICTGFDAIPCAY